MCSRELKSNYSTEFFKYSNTLSWIVEYLAEYTTIQLINDFQLEVGTSLILATDLE